MLNLLLFISVFIFCIIFSLLNSSAYAFVLYELVYFINPSNRFWAYLLPSISYSFLSVLFMFFILIIKNKELAGNHLLKSPPILWSYIILFFYLLAYFYAVYPEMHLQKSIYFLKLIFIISIAYKLIDTDLKLTLSIWGYIAGSTYNSFLVYQTGRNSFGRVEGLGPVDAQESNMLAAALVPSLFFCFYYFWVSKKIKQKLVFAIAGGIILNALILINSRGAILAMIIGGLYFLYFLYFPKIRTQHKKLYITFLVIFGAFCISIIVDQTFIDRFLTIKNTEVNTEAETGATRKMFWLAAWDLAKDKPFGSGYHGFNYYSPVYLPEDLNTGGLKNRSVHSTWFEALAEIGYHGMSSLIFLIIYSYKCTKKCKLAVKNISVLYYKLISLEAALLSYMIAMSFIDRLRADILYWCILFIACAYNIYYLKQEKSPNYVKPTS